MARSDYSNWAQNPQSSRLSCTTRNPRAYSTHPRRARAPLTRLSTVLCYSEKGKINEGGLIPFSDTPPEVRDADSIKGPLLRQCRGTIQLNSKHLQR